MSSVVPSVESLLNLRNASDEIPYLLRSRLLSFIVIAEIANVCERLIEAPRRDLDHVRSFQRFVEVAYRRILFGDRDRVILTYLSKVLFQDHPRHGARCAGELVLEKHVRRL